MSESLRDPQIQPADHCYTILQDHGPNDGGWGPAGVMKSPFPGVGPGPIAYTGSQESAIEGLKAIAQIMAQDTGKPTRLVRFSHREDVYVVGGSS
jgi:hypothetical protein